MTNQEINKKLKGKQVYGFKFKSLSYNCEMDNCIDKIGVIDKLHYTHTEYTEVIFDNISWYYPTKELEDHLVEEEPIDLNQLFNQIKSL